MTSIKPKHGFSLASVTVDSRNIDTFGVTRDGDPADFQSMHGGRMEIVYPAPTPQQRADHDMPKRGEWDDGERGADEYRDGFFPMMNALWPVELAYGRSEAEAADLMNRHGGATSLISIDGDYYIAMTGGGMDLSWHLAAAYVCCGAVPPLYILRSLSRSASDMRPAVTRAILAAGRQGAGYLRLQAKQVASDMREHAKRAKAKAAR